MDLESFPWDFPANDERPPVVLSGESGFHLLCDDWLIDEMEGMSLRLHHPQPRQVALTLDRSWEGPASGVGLAVLVDGGRHLMYPALLALAPLAAGSAAFEEDTEGDGRPDRRRGAPGGMHISRGLPRPERDLPSLGRRRERERPRHEHRVEGDGHGRGMRAAFIATSNPEPTPSSGRREESSLPIYIGASAVR